MLVSNKSLVAKLLATENVTVVQDNVSTASFDVQQRVLTLPMWADTADYVKDHLIGHEVAHALYTPLDGWHDSVSNKGHAYKSFLNVVEDARIEKLIQRKYPGLRGTFIKSYKHLLKTGFFGADLDAINKGKLIDRINTYFKCGESSGVRFDSTEQVWLQEISNLETWEEVVELTDRLFGFAEEQQQKDQEAQAELEEEDNDGAGLEGDIGEGDDGESEDPDGAESYGDDFDDLFGDDQEETEPQNGPEGGRGLASDTDEALRESIDREFNENFDGVVNNLELANYTKHWQDRVVGYKDLLAEVRCEKLVGNSEWVGEVTDNPHRSFQHKIERLEQVGDVMYKQWRTENIKSINHMVKEFEMRKSATDYARQSISKTGVIDTVKMNNYKITDDIFKKVTIVPEGKNHGFIMYLDMSGSMSDYMQQTVEQMLLLVHFTRQIGVPFRVYGFTDSQEYRFRGDKERESEWIGPKTLMPNSGMRLLELFSEQMSKSEMLLMSKALLCTYLHRRAYMRHRHNHKLPAELKNATMWDVEVSIFGLGGTPLDSAMAVGIGAARAFQKAHRLDVLNTIFLTDGASHEMRTTEMPYLPQPSPRSYTTVGFEGKRYQVANRNDWTRVIQKIYIDATGSRTIGYMITPKGPAHIIRNVRYDYLSAISEEKTQEIRKSLRANGFYCETEAVLDQQYYIPFTLLEITSGDIEVDAGATKTNIRNAFKKGMGNQKKSRKILTDISAMVA